MAPAVEVAISESDIIKEGTLAKQSQHLRQWRQRHFVLTSQYLGSFKAKGDYRKPTEVIPLRDCVIVRSCEEEMGARSRFAVGDGRALVRA